MERRLEEVMRDRVERRGEEVGSGGGRIREEIEVFAGGEESK